MSDARYIVLSPTLRAVDVWCRENGVPRRRAFYLQPLRSYAHVGVMLDPPWEVVELPGWQDRKDADELRRSVAAMDVVSQRFRHIYAKEDPT